MAIITDYKSQKAYQSPLFLKNQKVMLEFPAKS